MNHLDIKINNFHYTQRSEFSKIISTNMIEGDSGFYDSFENLPEDVKNYINDFNKIKENPDKYFKYKIIDNKIHITNIEPNDLKNIIIPQFIDGFEVTDLFVKLENKNIERIIMPDSINSLHQSIFANCTSLREVHLSNNIEVLPYGIFLRCDKLKDINLENITLMRENALRECISLKDVKLDNLEVIGANCFLDCESIKK